MIGVDPWLRRAASIGVAIAAALAVAACGGDGESSEPVDPSTTTASTTTVASPVASSVVDLLSVERPLVLAHAGGENAHPHSTPFAYAESVAAGVDVLDFDVRLTGDGVLVVHHDDDVDRTTDGTGLVADMTYDELHELDNAHWFTDVCSACEGEPEEAYVLRGVRTGEIDPPEGHGPDDFAITSFEEIIGRYPEHVLNIEIKGSHPDDVPAAEELARILTEADRLDQAVVTAFDDDLAEAFHELAPEVAITPGLDAMTRYVLAGEALPPERTIVQIPPDYEGVELLTPEFVERAHADGLVLWIWPNSREWENAEGYRRLLGLGVDGINAADPPTAVATVEEFVGRESGGS